MILLMAEILHHLGCFSDPVNHGITYLSTGAGFLPSTILIVNDINHSKQQRSTRFNIVSAYSSLMIFQGQVGQGLKLSFGQAMFGRQTTSKFLHQVELFSTVYGP